MSDPTPLPYDYQIEGGALLVDAPTYVKRQADEALCSSLLAGKFCYVLNARQMGKSSLKVRTMQRLQAASIICAAVDLQGIGTSVTEEQWYVSIINRVSRGLGLRRQFDLNAWWREHYLLSNVQRLALFLETVVLPAIPQPIVIFIDEVDLTLSLPFSSDDFFGALRECYNRRADEAEFRRLTFALLGVATPADLIQNKQITPFNIGQPIDLTGFRLEEAEPLLPGLVATSHPPAVLQAVLDWTGGQPFLTQKLCKLVATAAAFPQSGQEAQWVEQVVNAKIIENWEAQDTPQHLSTIRDRLVQSDEQQKGRLLGLYQQIVQQGKIAADDSPEQMTLRLTGLVVKRDNVLKVYNRIYERVFNLDWLEQELAKLRPYGGMIAVWLASGQQDESRLLRGDALRDALVWSEGKHLGDDDYRFLNAGQELETRDVQRRLEAEAEANQILTEARQQAEAELALATQTLVETQAESERRLAAAEEEANTKLKTATRKANRRNTFSLIGAAAAIAVAAIAVPRASMALKDRDAAQQEVQKAEQERDQLTEEKKQLDGSLKAAQSKETTARNREKQAQEQYKQAQEQEQSALAQYEQAQEQVQAAKTQLGQVNQEKGQAEQARQQAKQAQQLALGQLQTAKTEKQMAEAAVQQARATLEAAKTAKADAETATALERAASSALRQFEGDQTQALVSAVETGQRLQTLVNQKDETQGAVLVNQKLALTEYLALSPIYSLQQILSRIEAREITTQQGNVQSMSWSSDGQMLATGGEDGSVKLWSPAGELLQSIDAQQGGVFSVSWSSDGQTLATGGVDGSVKLWSPAGELLQSIDAQQGRVYSVSWSSDGQTLATGGYDGSIKLWSPTGELLQSIDTQQGRVTSVSWSSDGQTLATGGYDGSVKLWSPTGELLQSIDTQQGRVTSVSWSSDGQTLATGGIRRQRQSCGAQRESCCNLSMPSKAGSIA